MHTYRDAKRMAKVLESSLREKNVDISHGESLNIIAKQFGLDDWNTLSARIKRTEASDARRMQALQSWDFVGEHPTEFDYGVDDNALGSGRRAALIRYTRFPFTRYRDTARVFGTLAQTIAATPYHGKRLEIRADLATERVSHGATLWARVDKSPGHSLAFDNLKHHPDGWLFGDNGWTTRRIVVDVPSEGISLFFGFFLKGTGAVWAANFGLTVVDNTVPLTREPKDQAPREMGWITPQNLDFSKVVDLIS
ncbi:hypothetical protein HGO34_26530 [Agrobacterium vitis]|uniref:Glyoxalase-related protein domain-containing protein n=2 Tax=Agrobacterium vitis TaxID=373 RepID=A0A368NIE7_AGRVI|nr:glyoxalase superfamily protein [Agrobacterium vitis]MCF1501850.1 hypothetical protein [Allorhizobium sp. Av2]KAA3505412.1 hypothetical protein DXM22_25185 [Agrobacterium vitis]KAA3519272.1 hypothetical protein DXT89_26300 [Agrobacterium vitis]MCF1480400.1 hypothetical protein [Agrobacterium vitis]MCM2443264.1 hypothetical protein [Agrobacterium vitis]